MSGAALILWIVTAAGGATLAGIWLARGGRRQHRGGVSRLSPRRLGAHFLLAATGLALWIAHVTTDNATTGWLAFALLPVVASIGFLMFMTWLAGRGAAPTIDDPAEQHFPIVVVAAHGVFAVLTLVTVLIALTL